MTACDSFWLPDEAGSIYKRAHTVVSMECHSPIIAAAHGTPCMYVRQPTDTIKGQMWRDIGLGDWMVEIDQTSGKEIGTILLNIHKDYTGARAKLNQAMNIVRERQRSSMEVLCLCLHV